MSEWTKYTELADRMDGRLPGIGDAEADRFHDAKDYAADVERVYGDFATDEEWANAFWAGYHSAADDAAGGAR